MINIKGILLAGGAGTRMGMVSRAINKHCNLIHKLPMVVYPLLNLRACGISEILVVSSEVSAGQIIQVLGNGEEFGLTLTYTFQKSANGIADALKLGRKFAGDEPILVILGDNFYHPHPVDIVKSWNGVGAKIILQITDNPQEYGIVTTDVYYRWWSHPATVRVDCWVDSSEGSKCRYYRDIAEFFSHHPITGIIEKPREWVGNLMVTGMYMYDKRVWDIIDSLNPSARGEYEITDVNGVYLDRGLLQYDAYNGKWLDCGSPDKLLEASNYVKGNMELPDYGYHSK